ncbi:HNH endonuclease signature motif containing protein [Microbacterium sp. LWO12-1.2]|uniref:HNH endonuclease signature motif containing protein n=1 Tax=Microbacterium sp. LWO12-1.2 TaxID=3135261 RepID=UPI00342FE44F
MSEHPDPHHDLEEHRRLLDEWLEVRRQIAALEATSAALLSERAIIHDDDVAESPYHRDAIYRSMVAEYSAAGHVSKGSIEFAFADAHALNAYFPAVREAFERGSITAAHVREIARAGALVSEAVRNERVDAATLALYETAILVVAEEDTPARTRAHARQVAAALVGESIQDRHARAADERCVRVRSLDDGLALLTAVLPEELAVAIQDRLTQMARQITRTRADRDPVLDPAEPDSDDLIRPEDIPLDDPSFAIFGESDTFTTDPLAGHTDPLDAPAHSDAVEHIPADSRTMDQIRADLFIDLLLAADPGEAHGSGLDNIQARIQVTVAATALAGIDDRIAELDGHGPLHPDVARELAGRNTGWSRLFLDAEGMIIETDTYTPTEGMRRFLRARDQHCRFPGCRMPVHRCEIDHNHDHAKGGKTRVDNLSHFCTGHHALKHPDVDDRHRWSARARPDGTIAWTSPLGNVYQDRQPRRVMFV